MIERYEFRVFSRYRDLLSGFIHGSVDMQYGIFIVRGVVGDPLFNRIAAIEKTLRDSGLAGIFAGWTITRSYTRAEFDRAELLLLRMPLTQVSAEDYGTVYAESDECSHHAVALDGSTSSAEMHFATVNIPCGVCSKQQSLVRLPIRKFQNKDIYRLVGGEVIASTRLRAIINKQQSTGAMLYPIDNATRRHPGAPAHSEHPDEYHIVNYWRALYESLPKDEVQRRLNRYVAPRAGGAADAGLGELYQLESISQPLEVSSETRFGEDPFDLALGGHYECRSGEIAGSTLLTPLKLIRDSWDQSDVCHTRIHVSGRQGYYRPYQLLVISKRLAEAMKVEKIRGVHFEVVDLV